MTNNCFEMETISPINEREILHLWNIWWKVILAYVPKRGKKEISTNKWMVILVCIFQIFKTHLSLINLNVESLLLLSLIKVKSRRYAWSSDLFGVTNGFSLHNMIVIAPQSTRATFYSTLLTSNTKRPAFFLVRGHSETHLLESSVILVTLYSSITIRVSACIFPNFRQWKKDFTMIKVSRECRKFFIIHINCLHSEKKLKSKFHFILTLKSNLKMGTDNAWPTPILVGTQLVDKEVTV